MVFQFTLTVQEVSQVNMKENIKDIHITGPL